jgi:hypothetical protein
MLNAARQTSPVIELKLTETVRKDRELAEAAARMNSELSRSLLVSRMLSAFAITACLLVLYVVHHQGNTIDQQHQLIRQLYQDNQQLIHERTSGPVQQQPAAQQPAAQQPANQVAPKEGLPGPDPATQFRLADGCLGREMCA